MQWGISLGVGPLWLYIGWFAYNINKNLSISGGACSEVVFEFE